MKISPHYLTRKNVILFIVGLFTLLLITSYYFYVAKGRAFGWAPVKQPASSPRTAQSSPVTKTTSGASAQNTPSPPNATTSTPTSGQSSATTPSAPAAKTAVATTITSVQQNEHSLRVDTTINTSTNAGTCTLTLTGPPAHPLTETSNVQENGTTSSCVGFDIPIAQLSPGEWQIALSFENDSHTGTASRTVVVH
jgi:cytoskeletal protein RodZ